MPKEYVCERDKCTGCALCSSICAAKAISMAYDDNGFYYPVIDAKKCVDCGLCSRRCVANNTPDFQKITTECFLCWARDDDARKMGSSGGIFPAIARWTLSNGGYVVGAAFHDGLRLAHTVIERERDLRPLCGSKYIQSETEYIYKEIKDKLSQGKPVLFAGTPCQVAAVYAYCGKPDNLLTCDLICYGVGSTSYFKACIERLENKYQSRIISVRFRDKIYGCRNSSFTVLFENGKKHSKIFFLSEYGLPYSKKMISRKSCYDCCFSTEYRMGDITLGDYVAPDMRSVKTIDVRHGLSLVRVNSDKGRRLFSELADFLYFKKKDEHYILESAVRQKPGKIDTQARDAFLSDFIRYGFEFVQNKYCHVSLKRFLRLRYDLVIIALKKAHDRITVHH